MTTEKTKKIKKLKDVDSVARSQFIKSYSWAFFVFGFLGFIFGLILDGILFGILGLIAGAIVALFVSLITMYLSDKIGAFAGVIYRGSSHDWKLREKLAGDINQVRNYKIQKQFNMALRIVNGVLEQDSEFPEALFLKAQILWEGFEKADEAKVCLKKIMEVTPRDDTYHHWASTLFDEVYENSKDR